MENLGKKLKFSEWKKTVVEDITDKLHEIGSPTKLKKIEDILKEKTDSNKDRISEAPTQIKSNNKEEENKDQPKEESKNSIEKSTTSKPPFKIFCEEMTSKLKSEGKLNKPNDKKELHKELTKRFLKLSQKDMKKYVETSNKTKEKEASSKPEPGNYYVVMYEDIDYHNDWSGGITDKGVLGVFTSKEIANKCVQKHFSGWKKDFFDERLKYVDPETGLVRIKALCPEGEVMECWVEIKDVKNRKIKEFLKKGDSENGDEDLSDISEWTVNCDDSEMEFEN